MRQGFHWPAPELVDTMTPHPRELIVTNRTESQITGPSAAVAVAIIILLGAVLVTSIIRYPTVDDALKYSASLSAVIGVVTGAFVSYFFTRGATQTAQQAANTARTFAENATQAVQEYSERLTSATQKAMEAASEVATDAAHVMEQAIKMAENTTRAAETTFEDMRLGDNAFRALVTELDPAVVNEMKSKSHAIRQALELHDRTLT